jgi:hypothetical protein
MARMTAAQRKQKKIESYPLWTLVTPGVGDEEQFDFNAKDEAEALSIARGWGRHQGYVCREDIAVKPAPRTMATSMWHNEYVASFRD